MSGNFCRFQVSHQAQGLPGVRVARIRWASFRLETQMTQGASPVRSQGAFPKTGLLQCLDGFLKGTCQVDDWEVALFQETFNSLWALWSPDLNQNHHWWDTLLNIFQLRYPFYNRSHWVGPYLLHTNMGVMGLSPMYFPTMAIVYRETDRQKDLEWFRDHFRETYTTCGPRASPISIHFLCDVFGASAPPSD